jgi:hypothetical protein
MSAQEVSPQVLRIAQLDPRVSEAIYPHMSMSGRLDRVGSEEQCDAAGHEPQ